jgi:type I restriction enzyme, S subunit
MNPKERKLGDFFSIKHGYAFDSRYFSDAGEYILLTPGNFEEEGGFRNKRGREKFYTGYIPEEYVLKKGALLVVMTEQAEGLLGSSALIPTTNQYLHNQRLGLVTNLDEQKLDKRFLYYLFNSYEVRKQIHIGAGGTKVRHTSPGRIEKVKFKYLPIENQRKIAEILLSWDRAVATIMQLIKLKTSLKRGLMQQLLKGKKRFKEFEEQDWKEVRLGDIFREIQDTNDGGDNHSVMTISARMGLVSQQDKFDRVIAGKSLKKYTQIKREDFAYNKGNSKSYQMGCIYQLEDRESALVPFVYICFRPTDAVCSTFYKHWFLAHSLDRQLKRIITSSARGDGLLNVNADDFFKLKVPFPPKDEQIAISQVFQAVDKEIELLQKQLGLLKEQKRGLMQKLLTGQIRVKIGEEHNQEVVTV